MDEVFEARGTLGKAVGDHSEEARYCIFVREGGAYHISIYTDALHAHVFVQSLPHLFNFYRDLEAALNFLQPGLTSPLPDGDPNIVDAMKVIYEADQIRRGIK